MKSIPRAVPFLFCALLLWPSRLPANEPKPPSAALQLARQLNEAFVEVAETVAASVVVIRVVHRPSHLDLELEEGHPLEEFFRKQREREGNPRGRAPREFDGEGSGVIIRADGHILTNGHVVEGAEKIKIRFRDGRELDAEIRGVDAQSDIAVLKVAASDLRVARLGDSSRVRVGEFAIAIGAPFQFDYSVTFGHISGKGRSVIPSYAGGHSMDQDFIQTDASINPGNSGGPLVNIEGEVVGINTLIRGLNTGIGFAVPINLAMEVADQLITHGKFTRPWLGVGIRSLREFPEYRTHGVEEGVLIHALMPDGPAMKSELKAGDVVIAVDGKPVATAQELKNEIRSKVIGEQVTLEVVRVDKNLKITVLPGAWPELAATQMVQRPAPTGSAASYEAVNLGITVKALTRELAKEHALEAAEGVLVTAIEPGSLIAHRDIRVGDVITHINRQPVKTLKQFREATKQVDLDKGFSMNINSGGVPKFEVLKNSDR
jgi:serine protease Do